MFTERKPLVPFAIMLSLIKAAEVLHMLRRATTARGNVRIY